MYAAPKLQDVVIILPAMKISNILAVDLRNVSEPLSCGLCTELVFSVSAIVPKSTATTTTTADPTADTALATAATVPCYSATATVG